MDENKNIINDDMDFDIDKVLEARKKAPARPAQALSSASQHPERRAVPQGQRINPRPTTAPRAGAHNGAPRPAQARGASTASPASPQRAAASMRREVAPVRRTPESSARVGERPAGAASSSASVQSRAPQNQQSSSRNDFRMAPAAESPSSRDEFYMGQRPESARAPETADEIKKAPAPSQKNAQVLSEHVPGQRIVAKDEEDEDIKIAPARKKVNRENEMTRKTDIGKKVAPSALSLKKRTVKKDDEEIGSELVISMLRAVIYLVVVAVIAAILSIVVINIGNDVFAFVKSDEEIEVTVPENATREDIAEILYENGVIKYKNVFKFYGNFKKIEENFVAGDYTVTPMMNYKSLYYEFKEKPISGTSRITIPEGFTTDEIINLMLESGIGGTKEDYVKAINEDEYNYWFVKELDSAGVMSSGERFYRLDGYLFPDTYEFYNASSAHTVIDRFLQRFDEVYTDVFKERAKELGLTMDQSVILASIIEKEAGHSSDFRNVSSVFHNRLAASDTFPRFESDATVVYAIQHITGERPKEVTPETISYESPYNTYLHNSFPPGAIANPGINALKYAVYPADTDYYFFVSSDSGLTLFASNKAEHDSNVAYIRGEQ